MPLFCYQALTEKGKKISGTVDADTLQEARLKLIRRQIAAFRIEPLSTQQIRLKLAKTDLLNLTREIARLLQAGLPLFEALSALEEKYQSQKAHRLLLDLCDQVRGGTSFSEALKTHPECFDILYVSMIANAEKTGRLGPALGELGQLLARQLQVKKQLVAALLYPALLTAFCMGVLSALLFFVIPSLQELFEGRDLHPFTTAVFAVSRFACSAKLPLGCLVLSLSASAAAALFFSSWKKKILAASHRLPVLKELFAKVAFVRFCRASAALLEGGLPLIEAFGQARGVMRHSLLERAVAAAETRISQGESIRAPFQNHPLIPSLVPRMLGIAEESGKLPSMMHQIAEIYEEELEKTLSHFSTVAQPVLLLLLGGLIGFVLLSVLLPLTDVSSFATG